MAVLVDGHLNPDRLDLIQAQREIEPLLKIYRRLRKAHPFDGSLDIIRAFIAVLSKKFNVDGFPHPHGVHKSPIQIKKHYLFIFQKILYHKFSNNSRSLSVSFRYSPGFKVSSSFRGPMDRRFKWSTGQLTSSIIRFTWWNFPS